jgi:hypothetical protein
MIVCLATESDIDALIRMVGLYTGGLPCHSFTTPRFVSTFITISTEKCSLM